MSLCASCEVSDCNCKGEGEELKREGVGEEDSVKEKAWDPPAQLYTQY